MMLLAPLTASTFIVKLIKSTITAFSGRGTFKGSLEYSGIKIPICKSTKCEFLYRNNIIKAFYLVSHANHEHKVLVCLP